MCVSQSQIRESPPAVTIDYRFSTIDATPDSDFAVAGRYVTK